jgi:hypothetical protein
VNLDVSHRVSGAGQKRRGRSSNSAKVFVWTLRSGGDSCLVSPSAAGTAFVDADTEFDLESAIISL